MCGIAGLWTFSPGDGGNLCAQAAGMAAALAHRGPDDEGTWCDAKAGLALGFRRLAILDLSRAGAQPMLSASGRYAIVLNGEIYNFRRLRDELPAMAFRGNSDSEVALACIELWGIERALDRFIGMFALAVWDSQEKRLTLVRDRAGVKPLYYVQHAGAFFFASELRAFPRQTPRVIDRGALDLYLRFGYVPAPWSIFEGIRKLPPGCMLSVSASGSMSLRRYWSAAEQMEAASNLPFDGGEDAAVEAVEALIRDSVRLRLISDVPLGLFLSGGVDSPLVAAMMRGEAGGVSTFTVGFEGAGNEAPRAAAIARHLGTDHTEVMVGAAEVIDIVPKLAGIYDEPFGDTSAIPTFLVSRLARKSVTVALSGDGGDELFGGYHRYFLGQRVMRRVAGVPRLLRRPAGAALRQMAKLPLRRNLADRLRGLGSALVLDDPIAKYLADLGAADLNVLGAPDHLFPLVTKEEWPQLDNPVDLMMYLDFVSYLPDGILTKVDRASMAVGLEVREPLLDHRLAELAWSLPMSMKIRDGRGKWILRRILSRSIPDSMIERGKYGFGLPIERWLGGPLREWAESLIAAPGIAADGWFDPAAVARLWNDGPVAGSEASLWRLLAFQQWMANAER